MKYDRARVFHDRAKKKLAGGVSSHFRMAGYPVPLTFERGEGAYLIDVDGNRYLDFVLGQGPMILGHAHPEWNRQVTEALADGMLYAGQHSREIELAERVAANVPGAELMRFGNSSSESVQGALRIARHLTGRQKYVKFEGQYHGWFDNVVYSVAPPPDIAGPENQPTAVPWTKGMFEGSSEEVIVASWNRPQDITSLLTEHKNEIAAVICEPIMCNTGCIEPAHGYLAGLSSLCEAYGIILIFDETITGFRVGLGGAQGRYGITPDLTILGKAMGGGAPISALAGTETAMQPLVDGTVLQAGTYNANVFAVAASLATLDVLEADDNRAHTNMYALGKQLMDGLAAAAKSAGIAMRVQGLGPMVHTCFTEKEKIANYREYQQTDSAMLSKFVIGLQERGVRVLGRGMWYLSAVHSEADINTAIEAAGEVLQDMAK